MAEEIEEEIEGAFVEEGVEVLQEVVVEEVQEVDHKISIRSRPFYQAPLLF